jgi:hypothetical protein
MANLNGRRLVGSRDWERKWEKLNDKIALSFLEAYVVETIVAAITGRGEHQPSWHRALVVWPSRRRSCRCIP